jgi:hypothetical protein
MSSDMDHTLIETYVSLRRGFSFWPILNMAFGIGGNLTCLLLFLFHHEFKKTSSFIFLSYILALSTASLFVWNLDAFIIAVAGFRLEDLSTASCKAVPFLGYTLLESTAWVTVLISIDRYITLQSSPGTLLDRLPFNSVRSAHIWSLVMILIFTAGNIHILVLSDLTTFTSIQLSNSSEGSTNSVDVNIKALKCHEFSEHDMDFWWPRIHIKIYWVVPFFIILAFNILLVLKMRSPHNAVQAEICQNMREVRRRNKVTHLVVVVTFVFLCLNLPTSILWSEFFFSSKILNSILDSSLMIFEFII